jgi:transposase
MTTVRQIILLLLRGFSGRNIAVELDLGYPTVTRYAKRIKASGQSLEALLELSDPELETLMLSDTRKNKPPVDPRTAVLLEQKDYFLQELKRPHVTRRTLWDEYKRQHPGGYQYSKFCELLMEVQLAAKATMHHEYVAGDKLLIDFAGDKMRYCNRATGEVTEVPVFVAVLPYSGYTFVIALENATLPQVIKALNECLLYFGGAPKALKCDNMKQAVIKASKYEPAFNVLMEEWATHNGMALLAARPFKPRDKAHVESEVNIAYKRIYAPLRNEMFYSIEELNAAIARQLDEHNHQRFQKKKYSRYQRFADMEKQTLQPLPANGYVIKNRCERKMYFNYHFELDGHQYSLPYQFIGKQVTAVYDTSFIEFYHNKERIAVHKRSYEKGYTTLQEHMPPNHIARKEQLGWSQEYFLEQSTLVGPCTQQYIRDLMESRPYKEQAYQACRGILRLAHKSTIGTQRVEAACKRALASNKRSYSIIENIINNNLDKLSANPSAASKGIIHDNLRGPEAYK